MTMPWTCRLLSHAVDTLLYCRRRGPPPACRLRGPADLLPAPQTWLIAHQCFGPCNRSLMLLTFAADAVGLPDSLRSRSFADTVDLPPLTDVLDLLIHPGPCDRSSTSLTFCSPADAVDLPIPPDTRDLPLACQCRGPVVCPLTLWTRGPLTPCSCRSHADAAAPAHLPYAC